MKSMSREIRIACAAIAGILVLYFGMNFLKDFGASLRDFFGGRTDSYEKAMLEGRETAQKEMRERAEKLGANAIVGVSFGYETMGQANSMIMISISGTAVVID